MKKTSPILILLTAVAACAVISGCRMGMDDSCTVWTDTMTYSAFYSSLGISLSDGYYGRLELSDYERSIVLSAMPGHAKHDWTKGKIKDYLTGRGGGERISMAYHSGPRIHSKQDAILGIHHSQMNSASGGPHLRRERATAILGPCSCGNFL